MGKRLRAGDVLEVTAPGGLLYLRYLGKHPEYGDAIEVCPVQQASRPGVLDRLFLSAYVTFYPATGAVARGLARVIGHEDCGGVPTVLRRPGARVGSMVKTWIVEGGGRESMKHELSADDLRIPIAVIWNHELLLQRVSEGWRPEREGA